MYSVSCKAGRYLYAVRGRASRRIVNGSAVPGFVEAIRNHILRAVHSTCQKVRRSTLGDYLRLDVAALNDLVRLLHYPSLEISFHCTIMLGGNPWYLCNAT